MLATWPMVRSRSEEVEGREEEDPDDVDEVPVEADVLDRRVPARGEAARHRRRDRERDDPAEDVEAVEPRQEEVGPVEEVRARVVPVVELVGVLEALHDEEREAEERGQP